MPRKKKNSEQAEKTLEVETWPQEFQPAGRKLAELNIVGNGLSNREGNNLSSRCCPVAKERTDG